MRDKLEICPVWGKLEIKFPVKTKETEAIMVVIYIYIYRNKKRFVYWRYGYSIHIVNSNVSSGWPFVGEKHYIN